MHKRLKTKIRVIHHSPSVNSFSPFCVIGWFLAKKFAWNHPSLFLSLSLFYFFLVDSFSLFILISGYQQIFASSFLWFFNVFIVLVVRWCLFVALYDGVVFSHRHIVRWFTLTHSHQLNTNLMKTYSLVCIEDSSFKLICNHLFVLNKKIFFGKKKKGRTQTPIKLHLLSWLLEKEKNN